MLIVTFNKSQNSPIPLEINESVCSRPKMACLARLKEDTKFLENLFSHKNERFQIITASVDEVSCRFIGKAADRSVVIHANVTVRIKFVINF